MAQVVMVEIPMPSAAQYPDPVLYPDLAAAGGLADALIEVSRGHSIDVGEIHGDADPVGRQWAAWMVSDRGSISVNLVVGERAFSVLISGAGHIWAGGDTPDLVAVLKAARAWRLGARLRDLHARFPFLTYDELAQAYEDGDPLAVRWDSLLRDPELDAIRPLLPAVHQHPRLGRLDPSVTHLTLLILELDRLNRAAGGVRIRRLQTACAEWRAVGGESCGRWRA